MSSTKLDEFIDSHKGTVHKGPLVIGWADISGPKTDFADYVKLARAFETGDIRADKVIFRQLLCLPGEFAILMDGLSKAAEPIKHLKIHEVKGPVQKEHYLQGLSKFKGGGLEGLSLSNIRPLCGEEGMTGIFGVVSDMPKLKSLSLRDIEFFADAAMMDVMTGALKKTDVEDLDLGGNCLNPEAYEKLADFAIEKRLKFLGVGGDVYPSCLHLQARSKGSVTDKTVESVARIIEGGHLEQLSIGENGIGKQGCQRLLKALQHPDSSVTKINYDPQEIRDVELSKYGELMEEIASKKGKEKQEAAEKTERLLTAPVLDELRKDGALFEIAKAGKFARIFEVQNEKLTAFDYLSQGTDGKTLLSVLEMRGESKDVFKPERWNDVKQMKALWDQMNDKSKDLAGGEPAFNKTKNVLIQRMIAKTQHGRQPAGH